MTAAALLLAAGQRGPGFVPDLSQAVVYEANLRAMGPFRAIKDRLLAIRALGVNVLWLMPVQPVGKLHSAGGLGSPYALRDYKEVNPEFGAASDLKNLIRAAHSEHMAVILDWVGDHTAWDSPWITEHPDWYLRTKTGAISPPLGTDWKDVAALDYRNAAMRRQMIADMQYWISDFGFDGFRCDAADRLPIDFWKTAIQDLRAKARKPILMLAEGFQATDYAAGFNLTYGWDFCNRLRQVYNGKPATELAAAASNERKDIPSGARRLRFITNHDISAWEGSTLDLYKTPQGVRTAIALAALYGGTPMIYCGEECGWPNRIPIFDDSKIDWSANPDDARWIASVIALRRGHPAFRNDSTQDASTQDAVIFLRTTNGDEGLVLANVRDRAISLTLPKESQGEWKDGMTGRRVTIGPELSLPPYGIRILVRK